MSNKNRITSPGLIALMKKKGLSATGDSEKDLKTCKNSGLFPRWSKGNATTTTT